MFPFETIEPDDVALALRALAWTLGDPGRADRLLALTGLDADALRDRLGDRDVLSASLCFLENHEPDLIACAAALASTPDRLVAARRLLEQA